MWVRRRRYQDVFNSAALATNALAQLDEVRAQLGELAGRVHDLEVAHMRTSLSWALKLPHIEDQS